jgi:curved DNA-binding protein
MLLLGFSMKDYYKTLGVERTASADEIKQAYRKLAAQHHPDRGGNTAAFQTIQEAYDTLGDAARRRQYDQPQPQVHEFNFGPGGHFNFDEIFTMFGARFNQGARRSQVRMNLWITLHDVATGGRRQVAVNTGSAASTIEIQIPPGIEDGDSVQYPNLAPGGGDLVITFRIQPDDNWQRQGTTLLRDELISIWTLIQGGSIEVTAITGERLQVTIPANTQPNAMLRVRGKGLPARTGPVGDMIVRVQARIPRDISPELLEMIAREPR